MKILDDYFEKDKDELEDDDWFEPNPVPWEEDPIFKIGVSEIE